MPEKYDFDDEEEISLIDIFKIFWNRRKLITGFTVLFAFISLGYSLSLSPVYRAECRILPPGQGGSRSSSLLAQMGGLADFIGISGGSTSGQLMIGILQGDTVVDAIIDRFDLMKQYDQEIRLRMREKVVKSILEVESDSKSGIISVAALDEEPDRAAELANAFVEELQKQLQGLSLTEASQRRVFFETQLRQSQEALSEAEDAMLRYQQSSGIVVLEPQMQALLSAITNLRAQIAAKNVEISALSTYAKRDNPQLKVARSELEAMNKELQRLEAEQRKAGTANEGDVLSSISQVPELGMEYQRYARDLKFATAMYEMMLRQVEAAKLDEAKDYSTVQIIDPAKAPDYKFKPRRARICIIGTVLGMFLGLAWAFFEDYVRGLGATGQLTHESQASTIK